MSLLGWFGFTGGLSTTLPAEDVNILHTLGWTNDAIDSMGEALAQDIIADYRRGILRRPGQTVDTTTGVTTGQLVTLREPSEVGIETFLTGVQADVEELAIQTADTVRSAGKAITELPSNIVLIAGAALVVLLLLRR